ncbi:hypothetical protein NZ698_18725 [Chryseobacterium sp. PBS4-4]|uniref:Uncharacterized protein n=1 Tax=Chryseobacterium edaphi TaxID=2976532 RepID=A0ABT2WAI4_9FLAO|nr:hypothetical protein [Chryseobacterium edaphi]MCU7619218.1 hypothetical protein [Chryseobacterium edaphi]
MKKIYLRLIFLTIIVAAFIMHDLKLRDQSHSIGNDVDMKVVMSPELLVFQFQPSLNENTEVIISFEKKYLIFRSIYSYFPEPPPPPSMKRNDNEEFIDRRKPVKPYYANLSNEEVKYLENILNILSDRDYKRLESPNIDGMSYNFSTLYSNKNLKNGFIAQDKTDNQRKLVLEILNILQKTNNFEENKSLISYYYKSIH